MVLACISLSKNATFKAKYDIVMGADILGKTTDPADLQFSLAKLMMSGG